MNRRNPAAVRRHCTVVLFTTGACLLPSLNSSAQEEGPVVVGVEREWETIKFNPVDFTLELVARYENDEVETEGQPKQRDSEWILTEALTAATTGYIGHPNFIELDLSGTFGLEETWLDSDTLGQDDDSIETLLRYNVSALIFKQSDAPATVYSTRSQTLINRQFGSSLDSIVEQHGARMVLRSPTAPMTFHYFHREEDQSSDFDFSDFNIVQDTFEWFGQWFIDPHQQLIAEYTFDNVNESGELRPTNSFVRHNAIATHNLDFGPESEHNLRSTLMYYSETGDFPIDRLRFDEALRLRHTPRFETLYDYDFDWQQTPDADQMFHRGSAGFRHRLFESLVTSFDAGGSYLTVDPASFTSTQAFAHLNFDYTKKVPFGRLSAGLFGALTWQDDSESGAGFLITDESYLIGSSGIIILNRRNVDPATIHVTDSTGLITYVEGIDYTVTVLGDRIEIRRVLGGDISSGDTVLVDYFVTPEPANTTDTVAVGSTARYDFDEGWLTGLGVYVRYFHQDQDRRSDGPEVLIPANVDDLTFGTDYRIGYLTLAAERQVRDSTLSPFNATRFDARYALPLGLGSALTLNATYDEIDRIEEDLRTTIMTAGGRWSQRWTDQLNMNLAAIWRHEEDTGEIEVDGFEQQIDLTWRYRQTTIYGSFRNAFLFSNVSDSTFQTFMIGLRREF